MTLLSALTGWLHFASLTLALGAVAARWFVLPPPPERSWTQDGVRTLGTRAAAVLVAATLLLFVRQFAEFRDPFAPLSEDLQLLALGTPWGLVWRWALAASVALWLAFRWAGRAPRAGWAAATLLLAWLAVVPGLTGHAAGDEELRTLALLADALHVWAAGAWIGGLACVLYLEHRWRREAPDGSSLLPALVPRFSNVAMASVATIVATGTFAAWRHVDTVSALWTTAYGRTLLVKLSLAAFVLALGALNFKVLTPRLREAGGDTALRRAASVELVLAQLVLLVTAILVRTSPMGH